jgi:hypothetical protein
MVTEFIGPSGPPKPNVAMCEFMHDRPTCSVESYPGRVVLEIGVLILPGNC